jgi:hypothetical protein
LGIFSSFLALFLQKFKKGQLSRTTTTGRTDETTRFCEFLRVMPIFCPECVANMTARNGGVTQLSIV